MSNGRMNRRKFLIGAGAFLGATTLSTWGATKTDWTVGCFNRPWTKWGGMDVALDGMKEAGFSVAGLLTRSKAEPMIGADASDEYLDELKKKIAARGLKANMAAIRTKVDGSADEGIKDLRKQIENAHKLGLEWLMSFGVDRPQDHDMYFKLMADGAAYAKERGVKVVLKPHGGSSGASEEILRSIKAINHPNFSIWYDAGNIIYYTGKDPVAELEPIAKYVTGFCAKDCAAPKADVMVQLGSGKVDFARVFAVLKAAGFNGPIMLEGSDPGKSAAEATANAKANREFLQRTIAALK
jgi:sugar phosphate isomerase/epimerase